MSPRLAFGLGLALTGCAASPRLGVPLGHPAHLGAPVTSATAEVSALPPVAPPDLPAALQPDGQPPGSAMDHGAMDHGAMDHGAMDHGATQPETEMPAAGPVAALADALDAYLGVHGALASDRLDADAARALAGALSELVNAPPAGDVHFWHMRGDAVADLRESAQALTEAADLDAARAAFGSLSVPFSEAVAALGVPDGVDLVRHTCGMADAPEGGVWLQLAGDVRNPYFGTSMPMCSRRADDLLPTDRGRMDHGAMDHEGNR